jgi:hypothetical protein
VLLETAFRRRIAAIEAVAVWIDVSSVELQAQLVPARRPSELDHQAIVT